jgi:hypothetical protein
MTKAVDGSALAEKRNLSSDTAHGGKQLGENELETELRRIESALRSYHDPLETERRWGSAAVGKSP